MSQLNDSDIILFEYNFHYQNIRSKNTLDIAFGIDRNFLFGCGVAIASILLNNREISCEFHVFTDYISDKDKLYFSDLAKQYNSRINIYVINCDKLKSLPSTKNWTYATYFRFIIADYFYHKHEKILYLDADIACKGSIKELLDYQFSTNEIAAVVAERDVEWWQNRASVLTTPQLASGYFNAGFLLINIDEWNLNNISSKAIEMLRDPDWVSKIT
ncbi:lipopolysaccharide 1,3-galactosyltransferase, partial [Escherichia coli]